MAASALAIAQSGFVTLNIDYRLDSRLDPGFPGQVDDLRQAVGYLRSNAGALGVDPQRIGALGTSAGGNLALLLATDSQGECTAGDRVSSVVTWSAPDDLATYGRANQRYCTDGRNGCPMLFRSAEQYLGCAYAACPGRWEQASVPGYVDGNDPPTLLFNGSDELVPLSQARDLASTLIAHGDAAQLVVVPGRRHAIAYAADALAPTIAFFQHYLG
jgi:acetyl esterase/lipase